VRGVAQKQKGNGLTSGTVEYSAYLQAHLRFAHHREQPTHQLQHTHTNNNNQEQLTYRFQHTMSPRATKSN
jgi:hypothetical protein